MRASKTKKARNDATKKRFRELTKEFLSLVEKGEKTAAAHLFPLVQKALDTAAKKESGRARDDQSPKSPTRKVSCGFTDGESKAFDCGAFERRCEADQRKTLKN